MIALFENIEAFNEWHEQIKIEKGIPYQLTQNGVPIPGAYTTKYVEPTLHPENNTVVAYIADDVEFAGTVLTPAELEELGFAGSSSDIPL